MINLRGPAERVCRTRQTHLPFGGSQTRLPPGATGSTSSSTARHPLPSLAAVMSAPDRRNMPHLDPQMHNGGLWFTVHDCMRKDIVATYQSDFWGPWWNFGMVPQPKKDSWWISFVQKYYWELEYHDRVLNCWEHERKESIKSLVSKRKQSGVKPPYIGLTDWGLMLDAWEDENFMKKCKTNSDNSKSDPEGLGKACHFSGAKKHNKVAHEMALEAGGVPPSATALVRRTHCKKDGTYGDKRAEAKVKAAEELARQRLETSTLNSEDGSTITEPSSDQLTAAYIEVAMNSKGHVYGLGSAQFVDVEPNETAAASLRRNLDVQMRMTGMEGTIGEVKKDVAGLKEGVTGLKNAVDMLLRANGIDPITHQPISRTEEAASAQSPHSDSAHGPNHQSTL